MRPLLCLSFALLAARGVVAGETEISFALDGPAVVLAEGHAPVEKVPPGIALKLDRETSTLTWTDASLKVRTYQLDVLACHPGPRPWSDNLAWLVARSKDDFWILWAYVNETGTRCWINYYHFAENRVRMSLFFGKYTFRPPETFTNAPFDIDIGLDKVPKWAGRKFRHKDFGPDGGKFPKLKYRDGAEWKERDDELAVKPLVDLEVPGNNGWASEPWTEVHCLARSVDGTRLYYVVTYTAVDHGWVVDLRDGRVLYTQFGEAVKVEPKEPK
ncbi:MAG: hypothetical protein K8T20_20240 [Planctomycetes bacterium]|nr:hypothetical protein [Planctomycetota bacterium]